ncbi:MAG: LapA family protein [Legionellales bacterium]|nr:LapA family protein [Legionellales bacterium]
MRVVRYLFLMLIIVFGFTFACLNATTVNINYYIGTASMPLSLLLVTTLVVGMVIGILFSLGWVLKLKRKAYLGRHKIKQLEHELLSFKKSLPSELNEL